MKISKILMEKDVTLSFEVFPPKTSDKIESVFHSAEEISKLHPDFMSVTYGAGGGTSQYTVDLASRLQREDGTEMIPHLTCISSTRDHVRHMISLYQEKGLENIMALRGDLPKDGTVRTDYRHAIDLIEDIRRQGDFCIGGACYPEGHPEALNRHEDLRHLKEKVDAGVSFLTTQMFFDNSLFYNFLYRARDIGITIPILAGIMPITNSLQMKRSLEMSGCQIPERFIAILDRFGSNPTAMQQAGIIYASEQIIDLLAHGISHIHVYTMNKPNVAAKIQDNISAVLH